MQNWSKISRFAKDDKYFVEIKTKLKLLCGTPESTSFRGTAVAELCFNGTKQTEMFALSDCSFFIHTLICEIGKFWLDLSYSNSVYAKQFSTFLKTPVTKSLLCIVKFKF